MIKTIDYYLSLQSPWTYLGHQRLLELAAQHSATIIPWPVDFGTIFPATGGLPLAKRSAQRQAYRMIELGRWRDYLDVPLNLQPRFFPVNEHLAAGMVIAAREQDSASAVALTGAILRAVWAEERDIADPITLAAIATALNLDGADLLARAEQKKINDSKAADSQKAMERGVFGAPSYLYKDELFWGQDRLEFLARALASD